MPYVRKNKLSMSRRYKNKKYRKKTLPFSRKQIQTIKKLSVSSGELKTITDSGNDLSLTSTSPTTLFLSPYPSQGGSDSERTGDKINIKECHFKCQVNSGSSSGTVRCYVYQTLEQNPPLNTVNLLPNDFFPKLETSQYRYKVLYDKIINISSTGKQSHLFNVKIPSSKLVKKILEFDNGVNTLRGGGDIRCYITTDNTTTNQMTADWNLRFRYYDP